MKLSPREVEKLGLHNAGYLAQKRLARGLRLNYTEAVSFIVTQIMEFARDGEKTVAQLMCIGKHLLGRYCIFVCIIMSFFIISFSNPMAYICSFFLSPPCFR
ncbi:hypothetical protein GLYMA_08G103032v4 [Glycine max]|nr:hypothetical protein GLYMA_08G103032v4 [Glycine max]KAH1050536.1 hypothetical protein GYH30_020826 [Glycine max]